jgi:hypothetical protein
MLFAHTDIPAVLRIDVGGRQLESGITVTVTEMQAVILHVPSARTK